MAVLSIGQVWGAAATVYTSNVTLSSATKDGSTAAVKATDSKAAISSTNYDAVKLGSNGNAGNFYIEVPASTTTLTLHAAGWNGKSNKLTLSTTATGVAISPSDAQNLTANSGVSGSSTTYTITPNNDKEFFTFTLTGVSAASIIKIACTERCLVWGVNAETGGSTPTPSVSADPESVTNVVFAGVTNQTIDLTYENISDYETEVSVHPNADGTGTLSPAWLTASVSDADDYATVTYSVSANEGAARTAYIKVYTTDGDKEATTIIPVSQLKYSAPTGTFELFTGNLAAGDYVLVGYQTSSSKYYAMNSTVTSNQYLGITEVSIDANDQIVNPDASLVWTIEQSTNGYYIKQGSAYLDDNATSNKNYAQTVAEPTTTSEWTFAYDNTWTITNYGTETTKKTLSFNISASRVACYTAIQSGNTCFYLYKKVDGTAKPSAELAYAASSVEKLVGAEAFTNELTNPHTVTVSYASDNTEVATVDPATGAVSIVAAGKAVITASFAGDDDYKTGSASYTIVVTKHAGTELDPYSVADAKIVIDAIDTKENAYVSGIVSSIYSTSLGEGGVISFYISADGATTGQQLEAYKCLSLNSEAFTALSDVETGATVVITGTLKKFNSTYELDQNCHLVSYEAPVAPKQSIANDQDHPYTVAQALVYAADGVTYDLDDYVYVRGVVYDVKSFNNGAMNIFIKDADAENSFELFKCAGINDGSATTPFEALTDVQAGDIVIGYGQLTVFNTVYEFKQGNYLVDLDRPDVPVTGIDLTESTASVEVGSTVTLHASVVPGNATDQGIVWSVTYGSDKASVDENGVVTGVAEGTAVIRAASHEDATINAECTVTITAVDPTKHTVTFDATIDISDQETSITKGGITITASKFNNNEEGKYYYQCYASSAMTVSSTVGNITNIELTCTASGTAKYGPGNWDFTGYSYSGANGSWTGSAETVEFGNASQQVRMTLITVTYKEDNREAAGLAWNPADDIEITVGDAFSAPALQNPNSIDASEISIESSNTSLATVTAGVVSLVADATGTATITATFNGNDDYKPATVSYNITVNEAGLDNVTFDSSEDHAESGETTITKSGFTLSFTSGSMDGTQAEYRLYKSQTMTLSSTDYLIKKIEFTCTSGNPITGFADATGLDKDNNEWTGESNTVELTASNAQVRMTKIKVFYVEDTRAAAGLAWSDEEVEITLGDAFTAATLQNPNSIAASAITIASDNENLAEVNEGVVSLVEDATGTAHITATFAGNETYKPATVSYTIIVNDPNPEIITNPTTYLNFGSVEQGATINAKTLQVTLQNVAAATVAITGDGKAAFSVDETALTGNITLNVSASSANQGTFNATLTISDNASLATTKEISLSLTVTEPVVEDDVTGTWRLVTDAAQLVAGKKVIIASIPDEGAAVTLSMNQATNNRTGLAGAIVSEGVITAQNGTAVFTIAAGTEDNTIAFKSSANEYLYAASSSKNYMRSQAENDANGSWVVEIEEGVATITAQGSNTNKRMRYNPNSGSPIFSCYATTSTTGTLVTLYMLEEDTPEPPVLDWVEGRTGLTAGNYYTICLPKEVTHFRGATIWDLKKCNTANTEVYLEEAQLPFAAGTPFIIQATADKLEVVYEGEATETPVESGALRGTLTGMTYGQLSGAGAHIYILKDNAIRPIMEGNFLSANRAYIDYDELDQVSTAPVPAPGKKVKAMPMKPNAPTGINAINASEAPVKMVIDGQLFILRGEKMYDATGRLVK